MENFVETGGVRTDMVRCLWVSLKLMGKNKRKSGKPENPLGYHQVPNQMGNNFGRHPPVSDLIPHSQGFTIQSFEMQWQSHTFEVPRGSSGQDPDAIVADRKILNSTLANPWKTRVQTHPVPRGVDSGSARIPDVHT